MENKIVIAIDGWSSCGKSTMAKALAKELQYIYVDSGAMYRAITLHLIQNNIDITNTDAVEKTVANIELDFILNKVSGKNEIALNGISVEKEIRTMEIADKVSEVAAIGSVRTFAVAQQQAMGRRKGIVMDGRDIGTVVFPDAELKIFMTASIEVRTNRRYKELLAGNPSITMEEVRENLAKRDYIDSTREISPLTQAADAVILDNSFLNPDEQLALALQWVKEKIAIKEK